MATQATPPPPVISPATCPKSTSDFLTLEEWKNDVLHTYCCTY